MKVTPKRLKRILNLYPPYLGAGVKVTYISEDWRELNVPCHCVGLIETQLAHISEVAFIQ